MAKLLNRLEFAKKTKNYNNNIKPKQKCLIDTAKQSTFIELRLDNLTISFQPVLTLNQVQ